MNMSYCRFENTFHDLVACAEAIENGSDDLSPTEARYKDKLIQLCREIAEQAGDEEEEEDDEQGSETNEG
jgi:hypothetical protein